MTDMRTDADVGNLPLTDAARRLLSDARRASDRLQHEYIGTEHVVLALAEQPDEAAILPRLGVDREGVRSQITSTVVPGRASAPPELPRPYPSRTQKTFSFAAESALALGHARVDVEHLVVGLMRERVGIGAQALAQHGLTLERAVEHARRSGAEGRG